VSSPLLLLQQQLSREIGYSDGLIKLCLSPPPNIPFCCSCDDDVGQQAATASDLAVGRKDPFQANQGLTNILLVFKQAPTNKGFWLASLSCLLPAIAAAAAHHVHTSCCACTCERYYDVI
jgi:hypothetical protein